MDWRPDRAVLHDIEFVLEAAGATGVTAVGDGVVLYKTRGFLRAYERLLDERRGFRPKRVLELGIWYGGSVVLWNEVFRPDRLVALDLSADRGNPTVKRYAAEHGCLLHWQTSQDDRTALERIIEEDFSGHAPDLVIDDASHAYGPTVRSFETLFPMMDPGSLYVIEDWRSSVNSTSPGVPLHRVASDLMEALARDESPISAVTAYKGILAIERGRQPPSTRLSLTNSAESHGAQSPSARAIQKLRRIVSR